MPRVSRRPDSPFSLRTQAVGRALQVLDLFSATTRELALVDVARQTGLAPPTALRLVRTLEDAGLLVRVAATDRYRLGPKLLVLSGRIVQHPVRELAAPYLRQLAHDLGHTVGLASYDDGSVVYLDCVEAPTPIAISLRPGGRMPAHCVASGRVLLAYLEPAEVERLARLGFSSCSPGASFSVDALRRDLTAIRRHGFAIDDGKWRPGLRGTAAPIFDSTTRPVAALSVVGFAADLSSEDVRAMARTVRQTADAIAQLMGYSPHPATPSIARAGAQS
jgi:IclR family transcriptional regulator, KDG regulon repressor